LNLQSPFTLNQNPIPIPNNTQTLTFLIINLAQVQTENQEKRTPVGGLAAGESKLVDDGVWPRGVLEPGRVRSRERRRDGRVVTSRGVLARQRRRDSLDGDGGTGDDLEVAEPADDGLRQASP